MLDCVVLIDGVGMRALHLIIRTSSFFRHSDFVIQI